MAQVLRTATLLSIIEQTPSLKSALCWLDPDKGLVFAPEVGNARYALDFGNERIVDLRPDAAGVTGAHPRSEEREPATIWPEGRSGRQTGNFQLILEGERFGAISQKQLLLVALTEIERRRAGTLDKVSREKSRTKRAVSRNRNDLNDNPKLIKHSAQIDGGWWVFTNNSFPETEKFIRRAAHLAGLHVDIRRLN